MRFAIFLLCALLSSSVLESAPALSGTSLDWSSDSSPANRFLAVHGRRAATFGYSQSGLESWAYPVQIFTGYGVTFQRPDAASAIDGLSVLRRVIVSPEAVTRVYVGPDFVVREKIFVPLEQPGTVITYTVEGRHPVDIGVHFNPVLDLMWPAGMGGQEVSWNAAASGYVLTEATRRYSALVSSPNIVAHDDIHNANKPVTARLGFTLRVDQERQARVVIASGQDPGVLLKGNLEQDARDHYRKLLDEALLIETPDPEVNRALLWSVLAVDQAWVCHERLGCGQVGGYGPSRRARRPQYDWFFAGDGMVSTNALIASGQYKAARAELEFILRYQQRTTGMIWHEMTQSADRLNWEKDYPYMYVHVGLTADFLETVAEYYRASGDTAFVTKNWPMLRLAYEYSRSLVDSKSGLPLIPSDKQGANEQDALGDELSLSAGWVAAAESFADLAGATGHPAEQKAARSAALRARQAIGPRYWDEQRHYWISGHNRAGAPARDREARPASTVTQKLFSAEQRAAALDQLAAADFQTDWGTRSRPSTDPRYDPNAYSSGSVWAIGSAEVANAYWAEHRPLTALPIWTALVPWSELDSPGHMHETLAGDYFHEEIESVPEQTWSSASFFTTTARGLLGLRVDGAARRVSFAPHLPPQWSSLVIRHLHVGGSELTLTLSQSASDIQLNVHNSGPPVSMEFAPQLPLGATGPQVEQNPQDTHARLQFTVPVGDSTHTIQFSGGVSVIPAVVRPAPGDASRGIKFTAMSFKDRVLRVEFEQTATESSGFDVRTPWQIKGVTGGELAAGGHITVPGRAGRGQVSVSFE